jgi:hypothetical protein
MEHYPYLPTNDTELYEWLNNFAGQLVISGSLFGLAGKVTYFNEAAAYFEFIVNDLDQARQDVISKGVARDTFLHGSPAVPTVFAAFTPPGTIPTIPLSGLLAEISNAVDKIKGTKGVYTDAYGEAYRIIGTEKIFVEGTYSPVITQDVFNDHVDYNFKKLGVDRIAIFKKVNADPAFVKLGEFTTSPAVDTTSVRVINTPDKIQAYAMGIVKDKLIGHPSSIITFSYGGPL